MTRQVHAVDEVETDTEDMKKTLAEIQEKNKERKKEQEKLLEKKKIHQAPNF